MFGKITILKSLCAGGLVICLIFSGAWLQAQTLENFSLEGVDSSLSLGLSQSRNFMNLLTNQAMNHNTKLGIKFSIADFVRRGQLTLNNKHNRPNNKKSISDTFGLDVNLPIEFSEAFSTRIRLSGNASFFPVEITKNSIKTSLNIENNFRVDAVQGRLTGKFDASIFPDLLPQTNSFSLRDTFTSNINFNLQGRASGVNTGMQIGQGATLVALDPNKTKSTFKFQSSASGGAGFLTLDARLNSSLDTFQSGADPIGDRNPHDTQNGEGCPGNCLVDDDGDGLIDEDGSGNEQHLNGPLFDVQNPAFNRAFIFDDDEDGQIDETADASRFTATLGSKLKFDTLNTSATVSHSGNFNSENGSNGNRQTKFQLNSSFKFDDLSLTAKTDQTSTRFTGNSTKDSNRINLGVSSRLKIFDIQISTNLTETFTRLIHNSIADQNNTKRALNIRLPIARNLDLNIKALGYQRTTFPNDPSKLVQVSNQTGLAMNVKFDFGSVTLNVNQSEFPLEPKKNRVTMSANASLKQNFIENVRFQTNSSFSFSSSGVSTRLGLATSIRF